MLGAVFGPDLVVAFLFILIPLCFLGLSIVAIVDICSHSKADFYAAGYSKVAWVVVIGTLTLFYGFGCLDAAYYLIAVKPKVQRIETSRRRSPLITSHGPTSALESCSHCGEPISGAGRYCSGCGLAISR